MPHYLRDIPSGWKGWTVKVYDQESPEEPHIHIRFRSRGWRVSLRTRKFLDNGSWKEIPDDIEQLIDAQWEELQHAWDERFGSINPVGSKHDDE